MLGKMTKLSRIPCDCKHPGLPAQGSLEADALDDNNALWRLRNSIFLRTFTQTKVLMCQEKNQHKNKRILTSQRNLRNSAQEGAAWVWVGSGVSTAPASTPVFGARIAAHSRTPSSSTSACAVSRCVHWAQLAGPCTFTSCCESRPYYFP